MFRRSALIVFGVLWGHASIGNALPITYQFAGQLDQVSTITIVGDPDIPTVADGDPWSATITFDDSFLSSGSTFGDEAVLSWALTVPTDPRFDLSSAAGDRLNSFGAAFDPFHTGSNDIFLLVLYAENIPTVGSTSDQNYTYWYTDNGDLELSARLAYAIDEGATAGGQTVGTPVSVPEPPILWLFGIGLAILVLIKRRSIRPVHIRPLRLLPVFSASI